MALTLHQKLKLFRQLQQFCFTYSINTFPYKKSWWKVQVNVVTPQELKMVHGESNEIKGEKSCFGVMLAQLVKASVGQADVQRFEPHFGHNWLSCGVFLVKSRHFGLPLAQTIRSNWQSLLAGGSVAIQTWSI